MSKHLLHRVKDSERWDQLAWLYYGNVSMQGQLVEANRSLFAADLAIPAILSAGLILKVPVKETQTAINQELLPPWKR